jgi:hypothetical protein
VSKKRKSTHDERRRIRRMAQEFTEIEHRITEERFGKKNLFNNIDLTPYCALTGREPIITKGGV